MLDVIQSILIVVLFLLVSIPVYFLIKTKNELNQMKKTLPELYENQDRQKIAVMQTFSGIGKLMELWESKKKFSWTKRDSARVIEEMELEKKRVQFNQERKNG